MGASPDGIYLDLCAGTLDFAATLARQPGFGGRIIGADFVAPMLRLGRAQDGRGRAGQRRTRWTLPFPDAAFDGAMVGWGLRNLVNLDDGLREAARVLRPGSRLVILDMALPTQPQLRRGVRVLFSPRAALDRTTDLETYDRLYLVTRVDLCVPHAAGARPAAERQGFRGGTAYT